MGDFEPFSVYFSTDNFPLTTIKINILNPKIDITELLVTCFADKKAIFSLADSFCLKQDVTSKYDCT